MPYSGVSFDKRLRGIVRNHQRMSHGAVHAIRDDGLIVARPRVYNPRFPFRGLVLLIIAAVMFKSYIYASLGASDYASRVKQLAEGNMIENVGAWVMQPDAVTVAIAQLMQGFGL